MEYNINRRPDIGGEPPEEEKKEWLDSEQLESMRESAMDEERRAQLERIRRRKAAQRKRDRMEAYAVMIVFGLIVVGAVLYFSLSALDKPKAEIKASSSQQSAESSRSADTDENTSKDDTSENAAAESKPAENNIKEAEGHEVQVIDGITYVDGIMIVNKTYSVPESYAPGLDSTAENAFYEMAEAAYADGIVLFICSGYRSYSEQYELYNSYAAERGTEAADEVSSRPGHSEHQTGLCMDVNTTEFSFEGTPEALWLDEHCAEYGFIIRFPKGKEDITGYAYEPWHIRYVGEKAAKEIKEQGICLEEYLDVTSDYANAAN